MEEIASAPLCPELVVASDPRSVPMLADALLVAWKDLRIEARSKVGLYQIAPFAAAVLLLFGLALGPDRNPLAEAAAGLFWVTVLFSCLLAVQRSFAIEAADDARDGLLLSGLDPAGIFFGKAAAVGIQLVVLEVALALGIAVLFGVGLHGAIVLIVAGLLATVGLACVGVVYGVVSSSLAVRDTLLPLLFLPVVAPVLLSATKAWKAALAGTPGGATVWVEVLGAFAVIYLTVGAIGFGPLLEDA